MKTPNDRTVTVGDMRVNLTRKRVYINNLAVNLTPKEFEILELLAVHKGTTVTKETILARLYPEGEEPHMRIIDVFLCKMRRKLVRAAGGRDYIHTLWGRGYVLANKLADAA